MTQASTVMVATDCEAVELSQLLEIFLWNGKATMKEFKYLGGLYSVFVFLLRGHFGTATATGGKPDATPTFSFIGVIHSGALPSL